MKSFNFKAQASLILTATLALTLFASHAAMAKGPKDSKSKQQQNSVGTNNGGGGGAIICPGKEPVLTDYWELAQSASLYTVNRLAELREQNYPKAFDHAVKSLSEFFGYTHNTDLIRNLTDSLMTGVYEAIEKGNANVKFDNTSYRISVNRNVRDPNDSGVIDGLSSSACHEERVIVSHFFIGEGEKPPYMEIHIRQPDVFLRMPAFDQLGLIMGHELLQAMASGNTGRLLTLGRVATNSEMTRKLNAWMAVATPADYRALNALEPAKGTQTIRCAPYSSSSERPGYQVDRMNFTLYLDKSKSRTILKLENYRDENVWLPTFAILPISPKQYLIPQGVTTTIAPYETGSSFDFDIQIPNEQVAQGELKQVEPDVTGIRIASTGLAVQFLHDSENKLIVKVKNSKGGIDFEGQMVCYRKLFANEKD